MGLLLFDHSKVSEAAKDAGRITPRALGTMLPRRLETTRARAVMARLALRWQQ